ncbi:hypothetical protein, partial [Methanosarcina sp.]|uniref:hypothetical protein n=1 Tax=Methanosarcina sp. TaxID=2213 RepID=UPI003BB493B4
IKRGFIGLLFMGESNYMVYLETKKRYHSIFAKFHQELKLLESVVKTLSGKILIFKKILRNMGLTDHRVIKQLFSIRNIY